MYLNNLENIMNILNHMYFFAFHEYVAKVVTFPLHVILIKLNACKDELFVVIKNLQKKKGNQRGWQDKEKEK
jgi:hypothetical protein